MSLELCDVRLEVSATIKKVSEFAGDLKDSQVHSYVHKTTSAGSSPNQATKIFVDERSVSVGANDDLNLNSLTDPYGVAVNFATVMAILIENRETVAGEDFDVVGGPSTGFKFGKAATDTFVVDAGEAVLANYKQGKSTTSRRRMASAPKSS